MDILKKDSYRKIIFAFFMVAASGIGAAAEQGQPERILIDSYNLEQQLTTETGEDAIGELNHALALCGEDKLKFRIQYRIGILYFKSGDLVRAVDSFEKVVQSAACPNLVRLCGLNMAGVIYQMQAKDDKALDAFDELMVHSEKLLAEEPNRDNSAAVLKLAVTAGFSRAEIYQCVQDYDSAIAEYKRIIACINSSNADIVKTYAPLALDGMSQIYLRGGQLENYGQTVVKLIEKYPDYYRMGIIKLEAKAINILEGKGSSENFSRGSFDAPTRLIAFIKDSNDKELAEKVNVFLKGLSSQYEQSYCGVMLGYHYAWLLDASGEKREAAKVFEDICKQAASIKSDIARIAKVIGVLADYAKFQHAIILEEESNYRQALEVVNSVKPDSNDVHMMNLSDSIEKALQTLKREVPKDVNN